jgi:chromosome segregation ATPase
VTVSQTLRDALEQAEGLEREVTVLVARLSTKDAEILGLRDQLADTTAQSTTRLAGWQEARKLSDKFQVDLLTTLKQLESAKGQAITMNKAIAARAEELEKAYAALTEREAEARDHTAKLAEAGDLFDRLLSRIPTGEALALRADIADFRRAKK